MNVSKRRKRARGVTLVELLVVVTILLMLAAFAIPTMRGLTEGRKVREAARAIDVYLTQAKIRALELQRPVGVVFQRMNLGSAEAPDIQLDACTVLRQVEVPPPYAGATFDARIRLTPDDENDPDTLWTLAFNSPEVAAGWEKLVKEGDRLQLNFQGPEYKMAFLPSDEDPDVPNMYRVRFDRKPILHGTVLQRGLPFQVFRQPQPSSIPPLRLPRDVVIDLFDSGHLNTTPDTFGILPPGAVPDPVVLFAPNGSVSAVYQCNTYNSAVVYEATPVMNPIFLMVGKWERTRDAAGNALAGDGLYNWQDATNLWMAITPANGFVTTAEVCAEGTDATGRSVPPTIADSRRYAREAQISKGAL